jgi:hypothetical protein
LAGGGSARTTIVLLLLAVCLTVAFWLPLWAGGGLVGSDVYAYFLPQKAFFAEELRGSSLPLWNPRIGWGYPQLAESQTGVFYPPNLLLYGTFDLNTAYNASLLLHYVLAFVFAGLYARRIGLGLSASALAALVYVYGWFPPRVCLEWAIIGGTWLPLAAWCVESYFETRFWRYAIGLALTLGVQMLAGHFTLAFVTQLAVASYAALRLWLIPPLNDEAQPVPRGALSAAVGLSLVGAFFLAAAQLLPTWELKQQSQRQTVNTEHDPGYGYIPCGYLAQIAAPWHFYADERTFTETMRAGGSRTNRVEAHLYFGLAPLALAVLALWKSWRNADRRFLIRRNCSQPEEAAQAQSPGFFENDAQSGAEDRQNRRGKLSSPPDIERLLIWLLIGLGMLVYATGLLVPVTRFLPGFSFFEGAGRFGIVTALTAGLWAGAGLDFICRGRRLAARGTFVIVLFLVTIADFWIVSRQVTFAVMVDAPPIRFLEQSPVRRVLAAEPGPVRLFSPGKNLPSLLGVATLPTYLGLGPAAYFDPALAMPEGFTFDQPPSAKQVDWLRRGGVTHLLSFVPLDPRTWPVRPLWNGVDPFLHRALGRRADELLYLYALKESRGRIAWANPSSDPEVELVEYAPLRIVARAVAKHDNRLILTDLAYPGWQVAVDGTEAEPVTVEGIYRGVELSAGNHMIIWTYRPAALYWGGGMSIAALAILLALGHIRFWHPHWLAPRARSNRKS